MLKVIVVGGGPAGIMAAISAAKNNEVILIERNKEIGAKLKLTGGGRCNITNNRDIEEFFDKIVSNKKFLYSALYTFSNHQLLEYFKGNGLEYKEELDQKIYTKSNKADEVIELLKNDLARNNVKIMYNSKVQELIVEDGVIKGVVTDDGKRILAQKVIVTTGGKSYPDSGSDGSMFEVLRKFHTITPLYAALIPLVIKEEFVKSLQGVAMKDVVISAKIKKKSIEKFGDMIFTHFGISGPAVLKLSSYITKALVEGEVEVTLDFLRDKSKEEHLADARPHVVDLNGLRQADRHRLHVAAGHAAIGVQPFVHHNEIAGLDDRLISLSARNPPMFTSAILLGAHRAAVCERADLEHDLGDALVRVARLALLDEIGILGHARRVENDCVPWSCRARGPFRFASEIGCPPAMFTVAARLTYGMCSARPRQDRLELLQVDVALEGMLARRVVRLVDDDVDEPAAGQFLMKAGRREVHVAGDDVALLDQHLRAGCSPRPCPDASE